MLYLVVYIACIFLLPLKHLGLCVDARNLAIRGIAGLFKSSSVTWDFCFSFCFTLLSSDNVDKIWRRGGRRRGEEGGRGGRGSAQQLKGLFTEPNF